MYVVGGSGRKTGTRKQEKSFRRMNVFVKESATNEIAI